MDVGDDRELLEQDLPDVVGLGPTRLAIDPIADRMLHERVRRDDEVGRRPRAEPDQVDRGEMHLRAQPVASENPEPDERRLQHERPEALDRERRPEHVADEAREHRPVHPELELLHESGRCADREVDQEEDAEEVRQALPLLALGGAPIRERLHHREQRCQPERDRDEDEVEQRRRRELPARQLESADGEGTHVASIGGVMRSCPVPSICLQSSRSDDFEGADSFASMIVTRSVGGCGWVLDGVCVVFVGGGAIDP